MSKVLIDTFTFSSAGKEMKWLDEKRIKGDYHTFAESFLRINPDLECFINLLESIVLFDNIVVDKSTINLDKNAIETYEYFKSLIDIDYQTTDCILQKAAKDASAMLNQIFGEKWNSYYLGEEWFNTERWANTTEDFKDHFNFKYSHAVIERFHSIIKAERQDFNDELIIDMFNRISEFGVIESYVAVNLFRFCCYLNIASEHKVPFIPSPHRSLLFQLKPTLRRRKILDYIDKFTRQELLKRLNEVTGEVVKFNLPLITNYLLSKETSAVGMIKRAIDIRNSKMAINFRKFLDEFEQSINENNTKEILKYLDQLDNEVKKWSDKVGFRKKRKVTVSFFGVGTDFELPDPFQFISPTNKKNPLFFMYELLDNI